MEEKKLTDEELLETMAFCIKKEECGKDCSLFNVQGCMWNMFNQSFQLIRRLQKKIKLLEINLANECEEHKQFVKLAKQIDEQQKAKIERLTKENSNVISMNDALYREKAELQKQVDELENRFENKACCNMSENCSMVQQSVKYTAREILTELKNTRFHKGTLTYDFEMALNKIAEKYSVEVNNG